MKNSEVKRGPLLKKMLKAVGLLGVVGMAGAVVLIAPLSGAGCGSDGGAGGHGGVGGMAGVSGVGGGGGAVDAGSDGVASNAAPIDVIIVNLQYRPDTFTVAQGGTVTVHNNDTVQHTMTSESATDNVTPGGVNGVSFDTGLIAPGSQASFVIPTTAPHGTVIPFYCTVHGKIMQGLLTVQ